MEAALDIPGSWVPAEPPWGDRTLRAYMAALRLDPCAYCGRPGGTVDHILPQSHGGGKWDDLNMTGSCEECNRRKDRGKDGGHTHLLQWVRSRMERSRSARKRMLVSRLRPGMVVFTPWKERAVVKDVRPSGVIYAWIEQQERLWRCANPAALYDEAGNRLMNRLEEHGPRRRGNADAAAA